jgi:hypothetical protein
MFKKMMIACCVMTLCTQALADKPLRVLYIEVDEGENLMSRNNPAFQNIYDRTGSFLQQSNIRLLEEAEQNRADTQSYNDALQTARNVKGNKLDALVTIALRHNHDKRGRRIADQMVAIANVIDLHSLQIIDTVRVYSPVAKISEDFCRQDCRQNIMRKHIQRVLPEFQDKLAHSLNSLQNRSSEFTQTRSVPNATEFTLTLKGFGPRETRFIEDKIARLDSTRDLSTITTRTEKSAFRLERHTNAPNVRDELAQVLSELDLSARIIQTQESITLTKVSADLAFLD